MNNNDSFSVRMGITPPKAMQVNDLDNDARTALYNAVDRFMPKRFSQRNDEKEMIFLCDLREKFFKLKRGKILERVSWNSFHEGYDRFKWSHEIRTPYEDLFSNSSEWHRIFKFIEFVYPFINTFTLFSNKDWLPIFSDKINEALKQENIGYRFTVGKFIPIISDEEIHAIEQATASPFDHANNHISKAITQLANRPNPDYANSIKESISAVESLVTKITREGNFDKAIAQLNQHGVQLHPQFETAIKNMYNFTSDENGVRHGATGEPLQCNQATACYMLIICSALVNFIAASKP